MKMATKMMSALLLLQLQDALADGGTDKVVELLKKMKSDLEGEGEEDTKVNDKMEVWCKDGKAGKKKALDDGESLIGQLEGLIQNNNMDAERLKVEIKMNENTLAKTTAALEAATTNHNKHMEEVAAKQQEFKDYIKALEKTERKLEKKTSFLATDPDIKEALSVAQEIQQNSDKYSERVTGVIARHQDDLSLLSAASPGLGADSVGRATAIINTLKLGFQKDLEESQRREGEAVETYNGLEAAKTKAIQATQASILSKRGQLAVAEENVARSTQGHKDAKADFAANKQFLDDANSKCAEHDKTYAQRQKDRKEEIEAIQKATDILTTPAASDLFGKTFEPPAAFLQLSSTSTMRKGNVQKATALLKKAADEAGDSKLSMIASTLQGLRTKLNGFEKVKKALMKLKGEITIKKQEEVEKRDSCKTRKNKNTAEITKYSRDQSDANTLKASLESDIKELASEIQEERDAISKLRDDLAIATEDRDKANDEYKQTVKDQQQTVGILSHAISTLEAYYNRRLDMSLKQEPDPIVPNEEDLAKQPDQVEAEALTKPEEFAKMDAHKKSSSVVAMLKMIRGEARNLIKAAEAAEKEEADDYKKFEADTASTVTKKKNTVVSKNTAKVEAEETLFNTNTNLNSLEETLEALDNTKATLGEDCDFLLDNFDLRQNAFVQEMKALDDAKAILGGSDLAVPAM
eukprot:TRINITY_DN108910_c0_g1_i1.p1 TRINITY_DN108910_c0_g1~~TRINITY_DN108910_c0_g1_i1.p1  ORF type:complete len:694 (-),score=246.49 TRINITY_DN108910_c0_g1_i1:133-2214(-)